MLLFLAYLLVMIRPRAKKPQDSSLLCDYAHRGLHGNGIPENSLAAFDAACREGIGIELDVQLSQDGEVMVFHDPTLYRMIGRDAKLCELDAHELQMLTLTDTRQKIPTLREVLTLVDGRVPLLVELKGEDIDTSICKKVAAQLLEYRGAYCIESFNPLLIRAIKKYIPHAFCGLLYTNVCRSKNKYSPIYILPTCMALNFIARPDFISYNVDSRRSFPVYITTKLYGAVKFVWTIKTNDEFDIAHKHGEHAIFERRDDC